MPSICQLGQGHPRTKAHLSLFPGHPNQCQCDATTKRCHQPQDQRVFRASRSRLVCRKSMHGHPLPCRFSWRNMVGIMKWCRSRVRKRACRVSIAQDAKWKADSLQHDMSPLFKKYNTNENNIAIILSYTDLLFNG